MANCQDQTKSELWSACKYIAYTAIGVAIGHIAFKVVHQKLFATQSSKEVNKIVNGQWQIPVISCDENGVSYIKTEKISLTDKGDIGRLSDEIPVKSLKFRTTPSDYDYDWHTAPRKQFIINLNAPFHITTGDGDSMLLNTGQVFKVEDITGKGHKSRSVNGLPRKSIFIAYN